MHAPPPPTAIEPWESDRAEAAAVLLEVALPGEGFTADDLATVLWDDPGVVLGSDDGRGFAAATIRRWGDHVVAYVKLVAVHPEDRRRGRGRALLDALETWCLAEGATELHLSGVPPVYLWPGVDVQRMTPMLCLAEAAGYQPRTAELNMVLPSTYRSVPGAGIRIERLLGGGDLEAMRDLTRREWPHWLDELDRAIESGTALGAFDDDGGAPVGFVCHSVSRLGLLGPMATDPARRGAGVGAALVGAVGADLQAAGVREIEICWVGPTRFYAKLGATVNRVFRTYRKRF